MIVQSSFVPFLVFLSLLSLDPETLAEYTGLDAGGLKDGSYLEYDDGVCLGVDFFPKLEEEANEVPISAIESYFSASDSSSSDSSASSFILSVFVLVTILLAGCMLYSIIGSIPP